MGFPLTPHALFSEADLDIADFRFVATGIDTLDLGFYVHWKSAAFHQKLDKLREEATGTRGIQAPDRMYLVLPSGKPPMYKFNLQFPDGSDLRVMGRP